MLINLLRTCGLHRVADVLQSKPTHPRDPKWPAKRASWLKVHPHCEACGQTDHVEVHHKLPFQYYPELELDENNFQTLCEAPARNCHLNIGHSGDWKGYNINSVVDAALMLLRRVTRKYTR